jgi:hypothetical protein
MPEKSYSVEVASSDDVCRLGHHVKLPIYILLSTYDGKQNRHTGDATEHTGLFFHKKAFWGQSEGQNRLKTNMFGVGKADTILGNKSIGVLTVKRSKDYHSILQHE